MFQVQKCFNRNDSSIASVLFTIFPCSSSLEQKKEVEEVRQQCETLNNIVLAEFDYFSGVRVGDLQTLILTLLQSQANYHRMVWWK